MLEPGLRTRRRLLGPLDPGEGSVDGYSIGFGSSLPTEVVPGGRPMPEDRGIRVEA